VIAVFACLENRMNTVSGKEHRRLASLKSVDDEEARALCAEVKPKSLPTPTPKLRDEADCRGQSAEGLPSSRLLLTAIRNSTAARFETGRNPNRPSQRNSAWTGFIASRQLRRLGKSTLLRTLTLCAAAEAPRGHAGRRFRTARRARRMLGFGRPCVARCKNIAELHFGVQDVDGLMTNDDSGRLARADADGALQPMMISHGARWMC